MSYFSRVIGLVKEPKHYNRTNRRVNDSIECSLNDIYIVVTSNFPNIVIEQSTEKRLRRDNLSHLGLFEPGGRTRGRRGRR